MPRRPRVSTGGYAYHVLNRGVGRMTLFDNDDDYAAFERVLAEAVARLDPRLLGYCLMPNHWHLVLHPRADGDLSQFMRWLTVTHTQRWHAHFHTSGTGPVYQGRFKSFPVQRDGHLLAVLRYVERNPLRASLVERAQDWRWSSLHAGRSDDPERRAMLSAWPVPRPARWAATVNRPQSQTELEALRGCVRRGRPYGDERWVGRSAAALGLASTLRPRGRPRKQES